MEVAWSPSRRRGSPSAHRRPRQEVLALSVPPPAATRVASAPGRVQPQLRPFARLCPRQDLSRFPSGCPVLSRACLCHAARFSSKVLWGCGRLFALCAGAALVEGPLFFLSCGNGRGCRRSVSLTNLWGSGLCSWVRTFHVAVTSSLFYTVCGEGQGIAPPQWWEKVFLFGMQTGK